MKKFLKSKKARHGSMAIGLAALFIVAVVLCNVIASLLIDQFDWKIDLTGTQKYEISDNTQEFLQGYDLETTIYVLQDEQSYQTGSDFTMQSFNLLKSMEKTNSKIHLSFIDLDSNPDFYATYAEADLSAGGILIVADETGEYQYLSATDLISISSNSSSASGYQVMSLVEQKIAHALEYLAGTNPITAVMIQGHDETDLSSIQSVFEENNYTCSTANLTTDSIPSDADLVMIAAPAVDYTADETAKLDAFLDNGGNMGKTVVYFGTASQTVLPNLDAFLAKWGIEMETGSIMETDYSSMYQGPYTPYVYATTSTYTENMADVTLPILAPYMEGMTQITPQDSSVSVTEFASTSDSCVLRPQDAGEDWSYNSVEQKSYSVALAAEKTNAQTQTTSRVVSYASLQMLAYMDQATLGNGDFIMSSMSVAANKPSAVSVVPKSLTSASLGISAAQASMFGIIFMALVPLAAIIIGVVVWLRRKDK